MNALLWKGVSDFLFIKNRIPFRTLYDEFGIIWPLILPYDYSNVTRDDGLISLDIIAEESRKRIKEIKKSISPKEDVFDYILKLIKPKKTISCQFHNKKELVSLGEFAFWIGHLKLESKIVFDENKLLAFSENEVSLKETSVLILGLKSINYSIDFIEYYKKIFIDRLLIEYNIVDLKEQNDNSISCKYIVDFLKYELESSNETNYFQNRSIEILELLRNVFPNKDSYSTRVVNNSFMDIELPYDPSYKSIKNNLLPLDYLVQVNSLVNNLFIYKIRPDSWEVYISKVIEHREKYNYALTEVIKGFQEIFQKKRL